MSCRAAGMHHTFWDSLMVEMRDLLAEMKILKEGRPPLSSFQLILIIIEPQALIRREELVAAVLRVIGEVFHFAVGAVVFAFRTSFGHGSPFDHLS